MSVSFPKPVPSVWLVEEVQAALGSAPEVSVWTPLRRSDQKRLNEALTSAEVAIATEVRKLGPPPVVVDGGRAEVQLVPRLFVDRYGAAPPRPNRRVRHSRWFWCRKNAAGAEQLEPFEEDLDAAAEEAFNGLVDKAKGVDTLYSPVNSTLDVAQELSLPNGNTLSLKLSTLVTKGDLSWLLTAEEKLEPSKSWYKSAASLLSSRLLAKRGFGEVAWQDGEAEEEALGGDVARVVILVHGIGEKLWSEEGTGLSKAAGQFRKHMHRRQLKSAGFAQEASGEWVRKAAETLERPLSKEEVLETSWWQTVHNEELDDRLGRITLDSLPQLRQIANFAVADALFFMQTGKRRAILEAVAREVEITLARFMTHHPAFDGEVVLVGHSLGGAILFELLSSEAKHSIKLSVIPCALFTLGSPTGMFLHCADDVPPADFMLPGGTRFFNVFHPMDPIAYRIEPLFAREFGLRPPEQVPAQGYTYTGGFKAHHGIAKFMSWATGAERAAAESTKDVVLALNAGKRVDWVLQDDVNMIGSAGELMRALPSHSQYFYSEDVAAFVQEQVATLSSEDAA